MTLSKAIGQDHVQAAIDAVMGIDASQAPTDPAELNDRLTIPQPGVTEALSMVLVHPQTKQVHKAAPLVYVALEAANRAFPEEMKAELKAKQFVVALTSVAGDAQAAAKGSGQIESPLRERQPDLTAFVERQLGGENSFARKMSFDDRAGVYALALAAVRAVDKHVLGPDRPVTANKEPGRNEPCFCGSGKKYKKCHGGGSPPA